MDKTCSDCRVMRGPEDSPRQIILCEHKHAKFDELIEALINIAAFDDVAANEVLAETGKYHAFDNPSGVRIARVALNSVEVNQCQP